jgi:hypothetical protein
MLYLTPSPGRNSGIVFACITFPLVRSSLKQREFLALKQGNMSVNEYLDKFTQLSCYVSDEVNTDPKRQEHFLDDLIGPLNYQLQSHSFSDFATLLNKT